MINIGSKHHSGFSRGNATSHVTCTFRIWRISIKDVFCGLPLPFTFMLQRSFYRGT